MIENKYGKYIITEFKPRALPAYHSGESDPKEGTNVLRIDSEILNGAFALGAKWFWPITIPKVALADRSVGIIPHKHDFDEVLALFGTNREDPHDLGGELEVWLENEKYIVTKSCLLFIPKGLQHGPIGFNRIDRPIFHSTCGREQMNFDQSMMTEKKYGKYIITELKHNLFRPTWHIGDSKPEEGSDVLRLDGEVMNGDFYVGGKWFWPRIIPKVALADRPNKIIPHKNDFDEILAFLGTNREDPHDLGGELEVWLENEKHILTKSCAIYIPKGLQHGPIGFNRIDRPIFHIACGRTIIS